MLEYAPSTDSKELRLKTAQEAVVKLTESQERTLKKAYSLLGFHARAAGKVDALSREDLRSAIHAITSALPEESFVDNLIKNYCSDEAYMTYTEFRKLVTEGSLYPEHVGRNWVIISLSEAETLRRILHVRGEKYPNVIPGETTELALRYSPRPSVGAPPAGDGGFIIDATPKWKAQGTAATRYEAAVVHSSFRFFDCDMFFSNSALDVLVRVLRGRYELDNTC